MKKIKCFGMKEKKCNEIYKNIYQALRKANYTEKESEKWIKRSLKFAKDKKDFKETLREAEKERRVYHGDWGEE